jgi:hypothetical protein
MVSKSSMPGPSAIFGCDGGKFGRCRRPGFAFHPGNTEQNILWKYILPQEWRAATYSYETLPLRWTRARSDSSTRLLCSWTHMPLQPSSGWILVYDSPFPELMSVVPKLKAGESADVSTMEIHGRKLKSSPSPYAP